MMGHNTNFYHRRIIKDITQVDKRAEQYMSLRLSYIQDQCKPFTQKLQSIKTKTRKYELLSQEQKKVIEESQEIQNLNQDIVKLKDLTGFYEKVLDQLEKMVGEVQDKKEDLRIIKKEAKKKMIELRRSLVLPLIQSVMLQPMEKSLPLCPKSEKKRVKMKPNLSMRREEVSQQNEERNSAREQLMSKIQKFNNTDYLFRECFQKKKSVVNRMIGQLQSNLVKKKAIFLKACNVLSQEKQETIEFEEFKELDADELISLVISFPHVTNLLMQGFTAKRKRIAEILIKQSKLKF